MVSRNIVSYLKWDCVCVYLRPQVSTVHAGKLDREQRQSGTETGSMQTKAVGS